MPKTLIAVIGSTVLQPRLNPNWIEELRSDDGSPIADEANVLIALAQAPQLQEIVAWNEFVGHLEIRDGRHLGLGQNRAWEDTDTIAVQTFIQQEAIPKIGREKVDAALKYFAHQYAAYHPLRDYLEALDWDGNCRLDAFCYNYLGAVPGVQPREYIAAAMVAWFVSAVARVFDPGCQADYAIVLESAQGKLKSSALRLLAGDKYFSDSLPADLAHKDARDHLRGKWILELSELAQFKRSEIETVKAFISRRVEQYRPSYGHHEIVCPRQCVFAGSTNDSQYLVDTTGNRRFWPIKCGELDLKALARDRDQIWAEVVQRYLSGAIWYLTPDIEYLARAETGKRVAEDPWFAMVAQEIEGLSPAIADVTPGEILSRLEVRIEQRSAHAAARVGRILVQLGWVRGQRHCTRGQIFLAPTREA